MNYDEVKPDEVAKTFVDILKSWAEPSEWRAMLRDNARETDPGVCHSHDWCDANMAMAEAFERHGLEPLPDGDADQEAAATLWNAAWDAAMPALGGRTRAELATSKFN